VAQLSVTAVPNANSDCMLPREAEDAGEYESRGSRSNMVGVGAYNERLVLSLIRSAGALSKSELARATKLSAQTLTILVDRLEAEHLVVRNEPQRGRVGQPSVPYSLNPRAPTPSG